MDKQTLLKENAVEAQARSKKLWNHFSIAMLLLLGLVGSARSAVKTGDQILGVSGGAGIPMFNSEIIDRSRSISVDVGDPGPFTGLFYLYQLSPNLGLGANLDLFQSGEKVQEGYPNAARITRSSVKALSVEASARYLFLAETELHPYLAFGAGLTSAEMHADYTAIGLNSRQDYSLYNQDALGASISVGTGLEYELTQSWILGMNLKWRYMAFDKSFSSKSSDGFTYKGEINSSGLLSVGMSIGYKFGK